MLRHTGRAAVEVGDLLHRVFHFLLTLTLLLSVGAAGAAWRLSRGPVDLGFLKDRIQAAVNNGIAPARVTIGTASIAWGGFSRGFDQPLILRLTDLTADEAGGTTTVHVPVAEAALSARWLLIGRILPRAVTLEGARLVLMRNADGSVTFDIGDAPESSAPPGGVSEGAEPDAGGSSPLSGLLAALGAPAQNDRQASAGRFSQLSAVSIHGARMLLDDRRLGMTWSAERADIDLSRRQGGGVDGRATLMLALGGQTAVLKGSFNLARAARSVHVVASLSQVTPMALAGSAPVLAPLAALDVPLTLDAEGDLGPDLTPAYIRLVARAGAGKIKTDSGSIPVRRAEFIVAGTLEQATLENAVLELQPAPGAAISTLGGTGQLSHPPGRLAATLHLTLDRVGFADLAALWPPDISPPAREWITRNIPFGTAHDGKAELVLETPDNAPEPSLIKATATLEGENISVTWLPTVPPVEQAWAHLVLTDPDKIEIDVRSARQKVNGGDPIAISSGHVTISGLTKKDQLATVNCEANGSVPSAILLLKEPRLRILDKHPVDLRAPAGDTRMNIHVAVPLILHVRIDDVAIHAAGTLSKVHLSAIAAGHDLDDGAFSLDVDTNRLSVKGTGRLAGIQANIDALMDFRAGPPSQVTQRYTVSGRATGQALTDAGLDTAGALTGEVGLNLIFSEYRNGDGDLTGDADLTRAELTVAPLSWRKPVGGVAKASARVTLSKDRLTGIEKLAIDGPEMQIRAAVIASGGRLDTVRLDRAVLGRTDVTGTIRLPRDGPIVIDLAGPILDAAAKLLEKTPKRNARTAEPRGPSWSMRGRFDRVLLAHDQVASQVMVGAESDGQVIRGLTLTGKSGSGKPFSMRIEQAAAASGGGPVRRLAINVEDAGSLLQGLDATDEIQGGALTVTGEFNDTVRDHTLSGTLDISDFRVAHAPALGKLLQAVTLYGLVDALGGPGLSFSRLTAPFELNDDALVLRDARAFSPSLGLTAKGRIDRAGDRLDLEGTLVPAYVFNSLLGRIPFIGGLFRAEKGGGLFAMNYSLRGPTINPVVVVNLLSAVTPGFLRGMFGLFDRPPGAPAGPSGGASGGPSGGGP